jgi:hypothetical protein
MGARVDVRYAKCGSLAEYRARQKDKKAGASEY